MVDGHANAGAMELQICALKFCLRTTLHICKTSDANVASIQMKYCPQRTEGQPWLHIFALQDEDDLEFASSDMSPEFEPIMQDNWGMLQCPCSSSSVLT
jgi:hypothetical protein